MESHVGNHPTRTSGIHTHVHICTCNLYTHTYKHDTHIYSQRITLINHYISLNLLHCECYHKQADLNLKLPCDEHGLLWKVKVKLDYENAIYDIPWIKGIFCLCIYYLFILYINMCLSMGPPQDMWGSQKTTFGVSCLFPGSWGKVLCLSFCCAPD